MKSEFTIRLRRVGGNTRGNKRMALGFTVPAVICDEMKLEKGSELEVTIRKIDNAKL